MSSSGAAAGREAGPVLLLFAESLAAIEVAWSLRDAGFEVVAVTRRRGRPALSRAKSVRIARIAGPEQALDRAVGDLSALIAESGASVVMPLEDAALPVCDRAGRHSEVRVAGPSQDQVALALDKRRQLAAAEQAGLSVPATRHFDSPHEALSLSEFPLVLKARWAVAEHQGRLERQAASMCADRLELEEALREWPEHQPLIAQPRIEGVGAGVFGFVAQGQVSAWSAHRRVRMMNPQGSGSSACASDAVDPGLAASIESMLADTAWDGMFMAEFLRDPEGRDWFMELNGRAWGSMALARRMGFEYPAWAVRHALDPSFVPTAPVPRQPVLCRHAGRELVHLALVLRGQRSRALASWPARGRTARDVLSVRRSDCFYNWRRGELPVFASDVVQTVTGTLLPRISARR